MKLNIEQIFYGRGMNGYGILGASPAGSSYAARVESLCGAVGTPGVDYGGEPFLMSVPEGDCVIMVCGRRGDPDSMGRSTLFFHALIAEREAMADAKTDAFSLFSQGLFADKVPTGGIASLCIDIKTARAAISQSESFANVTAPCVIRSEKPLLDIVRATVGGSSLELSWATLAFQPMRGFDVQVLPSRVPCSRNVDEYDATGKLVRSGAATNEPNVDEPPRKYSNELSYPSCGHVIHQHPKNKPSAMLKLSVLMNIALAAVCAMLLVSRDSGPEAPARQVSPIVVTNTVERVVEVPARLSDAQMAEIGDVAIKRFRSKQKDKFPTDREISDFDVMVKELPKYKDISEDPKFERQKIFLDKLMFYVRFVNKEVLEKQTP